MTERLVGSTVVPFTGLSPEDKQIIVDRAVPLTDERKLGIGEAVFYKFMAPVGFEELAATNWLASLGFDRIEWSQPDSSDDILLLLLWRQLKGGAGQMLDEFIIEFGGHDAANITLFNMVKEISLP